MLEGASRNCKELFYGGNILDMSNTQLAETCYFNRRSLAEEPLPKRTKIHIVDGQELEAATRAVNVTTFHNRNTLCNHGKL
jgi:hypothetical protein